jgi:hypothetical protein
MGALGLPNVTAGADKAFQDARDVPLVHAESGSAAKTGNLSTRLDGRQG